jgi:hypothetical protein
MNIETLQLKLENLNQLNKQLTDENEQLYHQFNHLMIRNNKLLKRVDDQQKIIDDLHIRIEELQLINGNMMQLNDQIRQRGSAGIQPQNILPEPVVSAVPQSGAFHFQTSFDLEQLYNRWKNYPGQTAQNAPNLRKQVLMLVHLYTAPSLCAADLFRLTSIGGGTGARYIAALKQAGLIRYIGARKKGAYEITEKGRRFLESKEEVPTGTLSKDIPVILGTSENGSSVNGVKSSDYGHFDHHDL